MKKLIIWLGRYEMDAADRVIGLIGIWVTSFILAVLSLPHPVDSMVREGIRIILWPLSFVFYQFFYGGVMLAGRIWSLFHLFSAVPAFSLDVYIPVIICYFVLLVFLHFVVGMRGRFWAFVLLALVMLTSSWKLLSLGVPG